MLQIKLSNFVNKIIALFGFCFLIYSNAYLFSNKIQNSWKWGLLIQILSWVLQLLSHKYIEKNTPAFKDGMVQSFLTAPLFVVVETLEYFTSTQWIKRL